MKKLIASISLVFYFAATCGVVINSHYCMNSLASVHLFEKFANICGRCGMDTYESNGCCHDELKLIKLEDDQNKIPIASYDIPSVEAMVSVPSDFFVANVFMI